MSGRRLAAIGAASEPLEKARPPRRSPICARPAHPRADDIGYLRPPEKALRTCAASAESCMRTPRTACGGRQLDAIVAALRHRGPDSQGVHLDGACGLAHTRLSILDLSARGRQPMASPSGRFVLSYNGEIYNFRELREELRRKGRRFESDSDSEVILHLVEAGGQAGAHGLAGHVRVRAVRPRDARAAADARPARHQAALLEPGRAGRGVRIRAQGAARCGFASGAVAGASRRVSRVPACRRAGIAGARRAHAAAGTLAANERPRAAGRALVAAAARRRGRSGGDGPRARRVRATPARERRPGRRVPVGRRRLGAGRRLLRRGPAEPRHLHGRLRRSGLGRNRARAHRRRRDPGQGPPARARRPRRTSPDSSKPSGTSMRRSTTRTPCTCWRSRASPAATSRSC